MGFGVFPRTLRRLCFYEIVILGDAFNTRDLPEGLLHFEVCGADGDFEGAGPIEISTLPQTLARLRVSMVMLSGARFVIPPGLQHCDMYAVNARFLPDSYPDSVLTLSLGMCFSLTLVDNLPPNLESLRVEFGVQGTITNLPSSLLALVTDTSTVSPIDLGQVHTIGYSVVHQTRDAMNTIFAKLVDMERLPAGCCEYCMQYNNVPWHAKRYCSWIDKPEKRVEAMMKIAALRKGSPGLPNELARYVVQWYHDAPSPFWF